MKTLVTPVGTSLFTNYLNDNSNDGFRRAYETIRKSPTSEWNEYDYDIDSLRTTSLAFIKRRRESASAELQSIAKIQAELNDDIQVRLLASDTIASRLAAEILADETAASVLGDQVLVGFDAESDVIKGLQIKNVKEFSDSGMPNLMQRISQLDGQLVINITGGYKAAVPHLTILSQIGRIPLFYTFEDMDEESPDLIRIPQVPLSMDWQLVKQYADVFSKIDTGVEEWTEFGKEHGPAIDDLRGCIEVADNLALFSWFGEEFWEHYQGNFLVEINAKSYFSYKVWRDPDIDTAVRDLYKLLNEALSNSLASFKEPDCFDLIKEFDSQGNLNHGGPINDRTFIFKTQRKRLPIRFAYSFAVNDREEVTSVRIFEILRGPFNHNTYVRAFRRKYRNPERMDFVTLTLPKPI